MGPRRYSSTATADDAASTEGIDFWIDDVQFICHGRISAFDLSEFAGPAADAQEDMLDAGVMRLLADLMRMVLGEDTYRAVTRHRREHKTPDVVMQQILMDVVAEVNQRPSARRLPSPGGPPALRLAAGRLALACLAPPAPARGAGAAVGPAARDPGRQRRHQLRPGPRRCRHDAGTAGPGGRPAGPAAVAGAPGTRGAGRADRLTPWLDAVEAIWVDEARARMRLQLLGLIAARLGWDGFDDLEDPADMLTGPARPGDRAEDPAARAAQIAAFLIATS